ncbi:MAG: hypothetical protein GWO20_10175, partial [Candidatus Korarchaeota archaeon]|nr:hypothetical protein [Candidatus Korarchaeota archaeon]NIU83888.1 hypothetical protein [Candidatus Thorarchaeota archaeon]NIW52128.1 hypothetical protein [Candidatus Korarchaeota archaeon]
EEPITLKIPEATLPGRITTGSHDLDKLLYGGIPEKYAVILTSPSCDEKNTIIKRYLETGVEEKHITFYVTGKATV